MDGLPQINRNPQLEEHGSAGAPPPPTEVKIRTMKSDLAELAASGGGLPRFENVKVSGLSLEKGTTETPEAAHQSSALVAIIVTFAALLILGVLGYFAYRIFSGS